MTATAATHVSLEEYFALDAVSDAKIEYYDGATLAMAGASPRHNLVAGNIHEALLRRAIRSAGFVGRNASVGLS